MDLFLCQYLKKYIDEETTRFISTQPSRQRYVLMLIPKIYDDQVTIDECIYKCNQIVDFVEQYVVSRDSEGNNDRHIALHIHKIVSRDNEQVARFANNINDDSLKEILCEDRILIDLDMDIIPRTFMTQLCKICGNNKFELMENEIKNYYACNNCWMPN